MEQEHLNSAPKKSQPENIFMAQGNVVAIYTILSILLKMKATLGLEAMLEYIGIYLKTVETKYPEIKGAIGQALALMSVEKIYKEAASSKDV